MNRVLGVVLTGGMKHGLKELATIRSSAALPFGSRYRAIDFVLSNFVNSGISNVGIIMQYSYRSLMDHLGLGREWDLDRKNGRLFLLTPYISSGNDDWYKGSADALYQNLTFLERSNEEHVLLSQGNSISVFDLSILKQVYLEKNADIVMVTRKMDDYSKQELSLLGTLEVDENDKINSFFEKYDNPNSNIASLGMYFIKRELLIDLLKESNSRGKYDFVKDILIPCVKNMNVYSYNFSGYWRGLNTVENYYKANMDLLNPEIYRELFSYDFPIYTKAMDAVPAKYNAEAQVDNSIIADGCIIEGNVSNSIIFRNVFVGKDSNIKNCILMQGTAIGENTTIEGIICDKNVEINSNKSFINNTGYPVILTKDSKVGF